MIKTQRLSAYAVILHQDEVLLSKLNRGSNIGKWNLPGGGIEHGESPLEALTREIDEEAGLAFEETPELLTVLNRVQKYPTANGEEELFHLVGIIYLIKAKERRTPKLGGDGESSLGCEWFRISELDPESIVTFVQQSLDLVAARDN